MRKNRRPLSWINISWSGLGLLALTGQPRLFDVRNAHPRRRVNGLAERIIDAKLYRSMFDSLDEPGYQYKDQSTRYTRSEIASARICSKGNNGLIFLNPVFRHMYDTARFVGMSRHPLPIYESWKRRHIMSSAEAFAEFWNAIARAMADNRDRCDDYLQIRFEDLLARPVDVMKHVYGFLGLDPGDRPRVRLKAKKHYKRDGSYGTDLEEGRYYWFSDGELQSYLQADVSGLHVRALGRAEIDRVLALTGDMRAELGYEATP
jgi:hypothetical protein